MYHIIYTCLEQTYPKSDNRLSREWQKTETTKRLLYSFLAITGICSGGNLSIGTVQHNSSFRRLALQVFGLKLLPTERHHSAFALAILCFRLLLASSMSMAMFAAARTLRAVLCHRHWSFVAIAVVGDGGILVDRRALVTTTVDARLVQQRHNFIDRLGSIPTGSRFNGVGTMGVIH